MSGPGHGKAPKFEAPPFARTNDPVPDRTMATNWDDEPPSRVVLRGDALASVPQLALSIDELMTMPLDHRAGFVASFVDGVFTIEMILDACALPREEALGILADLTARGVIAF